MKKEQIDRAVETGATVAVGKVASPAAAVAARPLIRRLAPLWWLALLLSPIGIAVVVFLVVVMTVISATLAANQTALAQPGCLPTIEGAPARGLDDEQMANAVIIVGTAAEKNIEPRGAVIAIATALQESSLYNLSGGDRDSEGLFQQRPSTGWGTSSQIQDPVLATLAFFGIASHTSNPGLLDIEGWENLPLTDAAQRVQRSAFPLAYAKWEPQATEVVSAILGEEIQGCDPSIYVSGDWTHPVAPPYRLTARFGQCSALWVACHTGLDYAAGYRTPILAASGGEVAEVRDAGAYGLLVVLRHANDVETWYAHTDEAAVSVGDVVEPGQLIAYMGWSGNVSPRGPGGTHLHLEVRVNGEPVNPEQWLDQYVVAA